MHGLYVIIIIIIAKIYRIVGWKLHCVSKKHVTTSLTINWSRIVRLQLFWQTYYQEYRPSTDVFIFPTHLFRALTLPWEIVET